MAADTGDNIWHRSDTVQRTAYSLACHLNFVFNCDGNWHLPVKVLPSLGHDGIHTFGMTPIHTYTCVAAIIKHSRVILTFDITRRQTRGFFGHVAHGGAQGWKLHSTPLQSCTLGTEPPALPAQVYAADRWGACVRYSIQWQFIINPTKF